jgi:NAD(P)H-dependent FMN reductase
MIHPPDPKTNPARTILVIMGSTRASRLCPAITAWVTGIARATTAQNYEIIDLSDWNLPMDDEPGIPARGSYTQKHTIAWAEKIAGGDGFVFVTPQYNWGYPAALKNAIDHLYAEWRGKPAVIVTYGGHGGGKCAAQLAPGFGRPENAGSAGDARDHFDRRNDARRCDGPGGGFPGFHTRDRAVPHRVFGPPRPLQINPVHAKITVHVHTQQP